MKKETNIIGTDLSLDTCKEKGYLMLDTEGNKVIDNNKAYNVFCYYPIHIKHLNDELAIDRYYSWIVAMEVYNKHKKDMNKMSDDLKYITSNPSFDNLLALCDSINAYCGLE